MTMDMRERLAEVLYDRAFNRAAYGEVFPPWSEIKEVDRDYCRAAIDAILAELREPTDGMLIEMWEKRKAVRAPMKTIWQAGIDAIGGDRD